MARRSTCAGTGKPSCGKLGGFVPVVGHQKQTLPDSEMRHVAPCFGL